MKEAPSGSSPGCSFLAGERFPPQGRHGKRQGRAGADAALAEGSGRPVARGSGSATAVSLQPSRPCQTVRHAMRHTRTGNSARGSARGVPEPESSSVRTSVRRGTAAEVSSAQRGARGLCGWPSLLQRSRPQPRSPLLLTQFGSSCCLSPNPALPDPGSHLSCCCTTAPLCTAYPKHPRFSIRAHQRPNLERVSLLRLLHRVTQVRSIHSTLPALQDRPRAQRHLEPEPGTG